MSMSTLGNLFSRPPIDTFAKALAGEIAKRYPPELDQQPGKRPSVNRMTRIIEDATLKAVEFQAEHRLGWFGKAKLSNAFRWELTALGYQKDLVEVATEAVVIHLSRGKSGRTQKGGDDAHH
jgi:hypothetical protein